MIHIEQGQKIAENENILVSSSTGDYEDNSLIEFCDSLDSTKILGAFAAQYIKYGSIVYKFNDPKELGEAILEIDPESTHGAASFVRMQNELLAKLNSGKLEPESLQQVVDSEQEIMEEKISEDENSQTEETEEPEEIDEETAIEEVAPSQIEDVIKEVIETPIEEPVELESKLEEVIKEEIIPIEGDTPSLPEEIISRARGKKSNRLKIRNKG